MTASDPLRPEPPPGAPGRPAAEPEPSPPRPAARIPAGRRGTLPGGADWVRVTPARPRP